MSFAVYKNHYRRQPFTYHPQFGWWHLPNFYARLSLGQTCHNFETNAFGMRDSHDYRKEKSSRTRLAFIGDSYTAGDGVDNGQRFSDLTRSLMPSQPEAMNFGLNGSGTDQQLLVFERLAKPFAPDALVWGICVENIARNLCNCRPSWDFAEHRTIFRPKPYFTLKDGALQASESPVPETVIDEAAMAGGQWKAATDTVYGLYRQEEAWQLMKAIIRRGIAGMNGRPVFLLPLPMVEHYLYGLPADYRERFAELHAPEQNIFVVDVLPVFLEKPESERQVLRFPDDPHYTPDAHMLVAEVLAHALHSARAA